MGSITFVSTILSALAGIGVFLIGCKQMSGNLESFGGNFLRKLFAKTSGNQLLGVLIGTVGTAVIQSSGATTVMVIGFVNAGVLSLIQASSIIYGANIGTTVTGQIVALGLLGESTLSTTVIFSSLAGVGAFLSMFAKKDKIKQLGQILSGFGMLFVGLSAISGAMKAFAQDESVRLFLSTIQNVALLVLAGALLTALVQSSAVVTSVTITMVVAGLITLNQGIYLTMGSNIGSCVVALLAGMTGHKNAKRTSLIHLLFNVGGVILFLILGAILGAFDLSFETILQAMFPGVLQTQLAMFHTFFNLITVFLMLPLTKPLVRLVCFIIPDGKETENAPFRLHYLDENLLRTPIIAVAQEKKEIQRMMGLARQNLRLALHGIRHPEEEHPKQFEETEKELDFLNRELVSYTVKLQNNPLSQHDRNFLSCAIRNVSDLERIGDYSVNILEYADNLKECKEHFSPVALDEIRAVEELIDKLGDLVATMYDEESLTEFDNADFYEDTIDEVTDEMQFNHIERLNNGICTPSVGAQYLSLSSDLERIADHFFNIARSIRNYC